MVEELLPALVAVVGQMNVDDGVSLGPYGFCDQRHAGLIRRAAALAGVASRAGTNQIFPGRLAPGASRDDMVQRQFGRGIPLAAILAAVTVAGEDITTVKFDGRSRQAIIDQQPDDPRNGNVEMDGRDPVMFGRLEFLAVLADLAPGLEVVVTVSSLLAVNDLGQVAEQKGNRPASADDTQGHIVLVEHQDSRIQNRLARFRHSVQTSADRTNHRST
jgi:hypothetical protein